MSGGKTTASALGGVGVILLELALALGGYQNATLATLLAVAAAILFLPLLNEGRKLAWNAGKRAWGTYGQRSPVRSMIFVSAIGAVLGAILFGVIWWQLGAAY